MPQRHWPCFDGLGIAALSQLGLSMEACQLDARLHAYRTNSSSMRQTDLPVHTHDHNLYTGNLLPPPPLKAPQPPLPQLATPQPAPSQHFAPPLATSQLAFPQLATSTSQLAAQDTAAPAPPFTTNPGWVAQHSGAFAGILLAATILAAGVGLLLCLCCGRARRVSLSQGAILDTERGLRTSTASSASRSDTTLSSRSTLHGHYCLSPPGVICPFCHLICLWCRLL